MPQPNRTSRCFQCTSFFRAVGSDQSCSTANTVLDLIVAWALDEMLTVLEAEKAKGTDANVALQALLQKEIKAHKRVLFDGNGYAEAWKKEAEKRGLPNLATTLEAIEAYRDPAVIDLYRKYGVLTEVELKSRYAMPKRITSLSLLWNRNGPFYALD
jgi:glutamine synthetase